MCVQGFPSVGDVHSTVPVPKEKWFEYGGERSGRFQVRCAPNIRSACRLAFTGRHGVLTSPCALLQGFTNADGSIKTECGIHVAR